MATTENIHTFNKPTTNIQRAFGLFALLNELGYTRKNLDPSELFIIIDATTKTFYSSAESFTAAIDIPVNYKEIVKNF